jgi:PKD repeat protein
MKFFTTLSICLTVIALNAQGDSPAASQHSIAIQTFDVSCSGKSNGSFYARAEEPGWKLKMYKSQTLVAEYFVAGADTFIAHLPEGNYTFVYQHNNQSADTVNSRITAPVAVQSSAVISSTAPLVNETVHFSNTSSGAVAYHWNFGDEQTSDETAPVHAYGQPGQYIVTFTAYNAAGCAATETYVINTMAPSFYGRLLTATQENSALRNSSSALQVRSHEGNATVTSAADAQIVRLYVYSLTGQLIFSGSGNSTSFQYPSPGCYIIQAEYSDGTVHSQQVMLN